MNLNEQDIDVALRITASNDWTYAARRADLPGEWAHPRGADPRQRHQQHRVEIQQNAPVFYRSPIEDMKAAQRSIHHQYYIWRGDAFARYLHAKTISVDPEICSIGSANIDIRSFGISYEINAVLYDEHLTRELESAFERDLADCREFRLSAYQELNAAIPFRDSAARLLSPLL